MGERRRSKRGLSSATACFASSCVAASHLSTRTHAGEKCRPESTQQHWHRQVSRAVVGRSSSEQQGVTKLAWPKQGTSVLDTRLLSQNINFRASGRYVGYQARIFGKTAALEATHIGSLYSHRSRPTERRCALIDHQDLNAVYCLPGISGCEAISIHRCLAFRLSSYTRSHHLACPFVSVDPFTSTVACPLP